jgi:monoamine oxidase
MAPLLTRRQALATAAVGAATIALPLGPSALGARRGRVDVVGAGLAGLACAAQLRAAGVDVRVWEARDRLGGRTLTDLSMLPGAWIECGGEFVNADHAAMRRLCREYGIGLQDLLDIDVPGRARDLLAGRVYAEGWADAQDAQLARRAARDLRSMGEARLDRMSAAQWLSRAIAAWPGSAFARYRAALVRGEFGVDPSALSALWLVADLAEQTGARANQDDGAERFRINGGTVRLVDALAGSIGSGRITRGTRLLAVARDGAGATITLDGPGGRRVERTDRVVVTLPPPLVRSVDMRRSGVPADVLQGIAAMGMGTNAKLIIPFARPAWQRRGWNGEGTSDTALGGTWEATMGQPVDAAALTTLVGGRAGVTIAGPDHGPAPAAEVARRLALGDRIAPGMSAAARRGSMLHAWARDPFARGSYAAARPGGDETAPNLTRPYGVVHFAGEHADPGFAGFMEGAVRSGQRAARQALAALQRG